MPYYHKKTNLICFDSNELEGYYRDAATKEIIAEILRRGWNFDDLYHDMNEDKSKMKEAVNSLAPEDVDSTEIFIAQYCLSKFYNEAKICFPLRSSLKKEELNKIKTLEQLKAVLEKNNMIDFGVMSSDGYREFQLKSYRGVPDAGNIFEFIESKLNRYGNNLGDINFLINMQTGGKIDDSLFHELHDKVKTLKISGGGYILLMYNENNKFLVINTIYPELSTTRIERTINVI